MYKNIVFVKLEKRLLNDYRWFTMSDHAQLIYIKLILLAAETYNKIPQNDNVLRSALRCSLGMSDFNRCIEEIKKNFPKFKKNKHFYYFDEFKYKTNFIPDRESLGNRSGIAQHYAEEEEDKDKKRKELNSNSNINSNNNTIKNIVTSIAKQKTTWQASKKR